MGLLKVTQLPGLSRRATWRVRRRLGQVEGETGILIAGSWVTGPYINQRSGWTNLFAKVDLKQVGGLNPGRVPWLLWVPVKPGRRRIQVTRLDEFARQRITGAVIEASMEQNVFFDRSITFKVGEAHLLVVRPPSRSRLTIPQRGEVQCWHLQPSLIVSGGTPESG